MISLEDSTSNNTQEWREYVTKEKYKPNLSSLLFLFIFLFIPDIIFRTPNFFWNSIFIIQSSLKYLVIGYLLLSMFYRNKFFEEKQSFLTGTVYLLYFLPLLLFQMSVAI